MVLTPGPNAPEALLRPCEGPRPLPQGGLDLGLSAHDAVRFWGRDRVALARCAGRHKALAAHIRRLSEAR